MSVSLGEVISAAGYDIETREDANWLLSQRSNFDDLVSDTEAFLERLDVEESDD